MAHRAVRIAVKSKLFSWADTAELKVNEDVKPPANGSAWLRLEFPVSNNQRAALTNLHLEQGSFLLVVGVPIKSGDDVAMVHAEKLAGFFRNQKFDGVHCASPSIDEGVEDGAYWTVPIIVPYTFYHRDVS